MVTAEQVWRALEEVKDPEIPVVSLVEMGIIREVTVDGEAVRVKWTPTFSGCPAQEVMGGDIEARIKKMGIEQVKVETTLYPPWTTEWITAEGRTKLKSVGLAPPPTHEGNFVAVLLDPVECPHCGSTDTSLKNGFGPTPCRMIYVCNSCTQPFEQFKPL